MCVFCLIESRLVCRAELLGNARLRHRAGLHNSPLLRSQPLTSQGSIPLSALGPGKPPAGRHMRILGYRASAPHSYDELNNLTGAWRVLVPIDCPDLSSCLRIVRSSHGYQRVTTAGSLLGRPHWLSPPAACQTLGIELSPVTPHGINNGEIGRASCRERV